MDKPDEDAAAHPILSDDDPIPKLPRASLFGRPSAPIMIRIAMFATMLYALVVMRKSCATGIGHFVGQFDNRQDAALPTESSSYPGFELITSQEALRRLKKRSSDGGPSSLSDADVAPR